MQCMNFSIMIGQAIAGPLAENVGLEACFVVGGCISALQLLPLPWLGDIDARSDAASVHSLVASPSSSDDAAAGWAALDAVTLEEDAAPDAAAAAASDGLSNLPAACPEKLLPKVDAATPTSIA